MLLGTSHETGLLVVTDSLLKEVGLAGQGDVLHEVEWVGDLIVLGVAHGNEQSVSNKLDVLLHEVGIHAEECYWQSIRQELLLNGNSFNDDILNDLLRWSVVEVREQQASEVGVHSLVSGDEFVGESETWHKSTLLQPED